MGGRETDRLRSEQRLEKPVGAISSQCLFVSFPLLFFLSSKENRSYRLIRDRPCLRPAVLELGGKAAALVLEKADLERAAHTVRSPFSLSHPPWMIFSGFEHKITYFLSNKQILFGSKLHAGQTCVRPLPPFSLSPLPQKRY